MAVGRTFFLFLHVILTLHVARGSDVENLINCETKQDSTSVCGFKEVSNSRFSRECFVAQKKLSEVFNEDEANYTMYVKPEKGFIYLNLFFLDANDRELFPTPLKIGRRVLDSPQWHQLTVEKEITNGRYRWTIGDNLRTSAILLIRKTDQVMLGARGPVSWTDQCDPRTSASMIKPSEDVADQMTNEQVIAMSSAAVLVVLIVIAIFIVQNRRRSYTATEASSSEATITTIIDFPSRPPPAVPAEKDSYIISPYSKVHDEDDHFYEEVYGTGKRRLQGQALSRTIPGVGLYPSDVPLARTLEGYPASILIDEKDPKKRIDPPDAVCLRVGSEKEDSASERDSINSTYYTRAIDSL